MFLVELADLTDAILSPPIVDRQATVIPDSASPNPELAGRLLPQVDYFLEQRICGSAEV